jgi:hypothetical protein
MDTSYPSWGLVTAAEPVPTVIVPSGRLTLDEIIHLIITIQVSNFIHRI